MHSGDPAVCTPSPRTVSAPRERSRSFRTPDTDRYFSHFVCFTRVNGLPLTTVFLVHESQTHPVRPGAHIAHNGFWPLLALHRGRNTKKSASVADRSAVAISHLRSNPLNHPFSLVCYCVSGFLQAVFRSVRLRTCISVCGAAQCTSRGDSQATYVRPGDILRLPHRLHAKPAHGFYA
ncbi:hypothetical protein EVAR_20035_1 [Eumeta japonica]|uniref:Uncharacterized protein n=1 Tax=Eumeta variegata TaxID=151549 RepID=A0A4C1UHT5_EUMVA|nr:hypothetical protein EVAR_20035_1 [Eumeta japonica]